MAYLDYPGLQRYHGKVQDEIDELKDDLSDMQEEIDAMSGGLTADIKSALLALFQNVAYVGTDGQDYYDDLVEAFEASEGVVSISAVFSPGSESFYDTDSLDALRNYLTVTATLESGRTRTVTDYRLSGQMTIGTNTITVSYGGKTAQFTVTVVWGFKLREQFASDGSNRVRTYKTFSDGQYTVAVDFSASVLTREVVNYVIGNKIGNGYIAVQCDISYEGYPYLWGFGIPWSSGKNLISTNRRMRVVSVCTVESGQYQITAQVKDVTSGSAIKTFSNTYSNIHESEYVVGRPLGVEEPGLNGIVYNAIIENRAWTSEEIASFLG